MLRNAPKWVCPSLRSGQGLASVGSVSPYPWRVPVRYLSQVHTQLLPFAWHLERQISRRARPPPSALSR